MSQTTALGIFPDRRPTVLAEFSNGYGWSPSIWQRLLEHRGLIVPGTYIFADDGPLDRLWETIEEQPEWQQVPNVLTFDVGVIPQPAYVAAADLLDEFERRLPARAGTVNHVPAMAELLRSGPNAPFFGIHGTSVTDNPFDPWDGEADDWGSGIPANDWYLLPQHRQMALDVLAEEGLIP